MSFRDATEVFIISLGGSLIVPQEVDAGFLSDFRRLGHRRGRARQPLHHHHWRRQDGAALPTSGGRGGESCRRGH